MWKAQCVSSGVQVAAEDGLSTWGPATHVGDLGGVPGSWLAWGWKWGWLLWCVKLSQHRPAESCILLKASMTVLVHYRGQWTKLLFLWLQNQGIWDWDRVHPCPLAALPKCLLSSVFSSQIFPHETLHILSTCKPPFCYTFLYNYICRSPTVLPGVPHLL